MSKTPLTSAVKAKTATSKPADKPAQKTAQRFGKGQHVVYPTHGVGLIQDVETQEIGGMTLEVYVIYFEKDRMTLRVPVNRARASGLRPLSDQDELTKAYSTLQGRAKAARGMWSRRAQEYETKINSGDIVSIAEVVRDLHKNIDQPDRSYSERMIYENALGRLTNEVAAAQKIDHDAATKEVMKFLKKQQQQAAA